MATFPNYSPDLDSNYEFEPQLLRADFGDRYNQVAGDGIDPYRDKWNMLFSKRPLTVINEIRTFLEGLQGTTFQWQSPMSSAQTNWKYLGRYSLSKEGPDAYTISFEIEGVSL